MGVVVRDRVEVRDVGDGVLYEATVHDEVFNAESISEKCSVRGEPAASGAPVGRAGGNCCQGYRTRGGGQAGRAARFLVGVEASGGGSDRGCSGEGRGGCEVANVA